MCAGRTNGGVLSEVEGSFVLDFFAPHPELVEGCIKKKSGKQTTIKKIKGIYFLQY